MKKSHFLQGAVCLAMIASALTTCVDEPDTLTPEPTATPKVEPTTVPTTVTPDPIKQMVLGLDTNLALEMLNDKGYNFEWIADIDDYAHSVSVNLIFSLHESGGVVKRVSVMVIDGPSMEWESPTDQFFADCNLPRSSSGGISAFMRDYRDELSTSGSGKAVIVYPVPGIEFKVVEWGAGLQFDLLSYTLTD